MRLVRWSIVWAVVAMAVLLGAADGWAQTATEQREAAVLKAPAGRMAEAQADLRALLANGTDDGLVAMDLATLLQQDGKAVEVFEKAAKPDPPDYALLAATRAYRDLRRYGDAARLARQGLQRFPARFRVATAAVAGAERRRQEHRGAGGPAHARRAGRAAGRAADGRSLCLAPGR